MATRKTRRARRDPSTKERYALVLRETSAHEGRLGVQYVLLRNLTPEQAAYWIRKFKR
jgi:hypothetical protein